MLAAIGWIDDFACALGVNGAADVGNVDSLGPAGHEQLLDHAEGQALKKDRLVVVDGRPLVGWLHAERGKVLDRAVAKRARHKLLLKHLFEGMID